MAYTPSCMHMDLLQALSILLLASMFVPGSVEESPSDYRIELIPVDANGGAMLSSTDGTNSPASSSTYLFMANYSRHSHEYLMELKMGTPPETFYAVADTGSDLVWTRQLKLCGSSTFTHGSCPDSCHDGEGPCKCKSCPAGAMCGFCCNGLCMFNKTYGRSNKAAKGFMGNETLTLSTGKKVSIPFGCAINWTDGLMPKSADGIVGLNLGPMSLVKRLGVDKFSYCLSNQHEPELRSPFWFGNHLDLRAGRETTPLAKIPTEQTSVWANKYYVELDRICIDGTKLKDNCESLSLQKHDLKFKSINDKAVMFVDSGTSGTYLEKTIFGVLKNLLDKVLSPSESTSKKEGLTCFQPPPKEHSEPEMVLYFTELGTEQAKLRLPWANYTKPVSGSFCLAIHEHESKSVLGNFHQQNIHMLYDLKAGKLSFVQDVNCSKLL